MPSRALLGQRREQTIAPRARLAQVAGLERHANAFDGVVGKVGRVVAPPFAVIVPEVVIRIIRIDPK